MPLFRKRLLVPAAALIVGLTLAGCSGGDPGGTQPAAETGPSGRAVQTTAIGETATVLFSEGNVASVTVLSVERPDFVEGRPGLTSVPEKGFLRLEVAWKTEEGVTDARSTSFSVEDPEGNRTVPEQLVIDGATLWNDGIAAGEEDSGYLTFDVPAGPQTLVLRNGSHEDAAYFDIP